MSIRIKYEPATMQTAVSDIEACQQALQQVVQYARQHCTLEGSFGVLLKPFEPMHNAARDSVIDNLQTLSETLGVTAGSVRDAMAEMQSCEASIQKCCEGISSEITPNEASNSAVQSPGDGGSMGGGGGSMGGGSSGAGPAPTPPAMPAPAQMPETSAPAPVSENTSLDGGAADRGHSGEEAGHHSSDAKDKGAGTESENENDSETRKGAAGHPVGCRCGSCDAHPAGCRCDVCQADALQPGCVPGCSGCLSGKSHIPPSLIGCFGTEGEQSDADFKNFSEMWERREPIRIIREGSDIGFDGAVTFVSRQSGASFDLSDIITKAYGPSAHGREEGTKVGL